MSGPLMTDDDNREKHLLERSRLGDGDAYGDLVRMHERPLYAFLYRLAQDGETAREVTQEAFVKAWFALGNFRGEASFRTWLHRIAINAWHNQLRARKGHLSLDDVPEIADVAEHGRRGATGGAEDGLVEREEKELLKAAIKTLPPRQREALTLRVDEGYPFEQVARLMGCTVGAAKASYFQAVQKLKAAMAEDAT
jgi:RNA polymerase sigma-70 factor (ECF subfamily)